MKHVMSLRDAGLASLAFFYFDFRDEEKKDTRNLVTSLLIQLSASSSPCCEKISPILGYLFYTREGYALNPIEFYRSD